MQNTQLYYQKAKEVIAELKRVHKNLPAIYNDIVTFEKNLDEMYELSTQMSSSYINKDTKNGKAALNKVETVSKKLNSFLNKYIKKHQNKLILILTNIDKEVNATSIDILMLFTLLLLLIGSTMYYIYKRLVNSFDELNKNLLNIVKGEGDLTKRITIARNDEIGEVANNMNMLIEKLQTTITNTKELSQINAKTANELSKNASLVNTRIIEESSNIKNIDTFLNKVSNKVENSKTFAISTKNDILNTQHELNSANTKIDKLTTKVIDISDKENSLAIKIKNLSEDAQNVRTVLDVIREIADQTNLLALNAAIEAARAGEHGRGFAVVADEVRKLAEKTQQSLSEIDATLNLIVKAIMEASEDINANSTEIIGLSKETQQTKEEISESLDKMINSTSKVEILVNDFEEVTDLIKEVTNRMNDLLNISSQNTKNIDDINSAIKNLNTAVNKLNGLMHVYKT
jgi:methyl-accepting chemotaxis protein